VRPHITSKSTSDGITEAANVWVKSASTRGKVWMRRMCRFMVAVEVGLFTFASISSARSSHVLISTAFSWPLQSFVSRKAPD